MIAASELAGFIASHAIWCISDADGLIPMVAFTTEDGQRNLERLVSEDGEHGRGLEDDPFNAVGQTDPRLHMGQLLAWLPYLLGLLFVVGCSFQPSANSAPDTSPGALVQLGLRGSRPHSLARPDRTAARPPKTRRPSDAGLRTRTRRQARSIPLTHGLVAKACESVTGRVQSFGLPARSILTKRDSDTP